MKKIAITLSILIVFTFVISINQQEVKADDTQMTIQIVPEHGLAFDFTANPEKISFNSINVSTSTVIGTTSVRKAIDDTMGPEKYFSVVDLRESTTTGYKLNFKASDLVSVVFGDNPNTKIASSSQKIKIPNKPVFLSGSSSDSDVVVPDNVKNNYTALNSDLVILKRNVGATTTGNSKYGILSEFEISANSYLTPGIYIGNITWGLLDGSDTEVETDTILMDLVLLGTQDPTIDITADDIDFGAVKVNNSQQTIQATTDLLTLENLTEIVEDTFVVTIQADDLVNDSDPDTKIAASNISINIDDYNDTNMTNNGFKLNDGYDDAELKIGSGIALGSDIAINSAVTLLEKSATSSARGNYSLATTTFKINIPANQAKGNYSGNVTITLTD
jgi:hypothetical protein